MTNQPVPSWAGVGSFRDNIIPRSDATLLKVKAIVEAGPITKSDVGARVQVVGRECPKTVRFVGQLHHKDAWRVGVELDRAVGNMDGAYKGHRYFICAGSGDCGILVPVKHMHRIPASTKVTKRWSTDRTNSSATGGSSTEMRGLQETVFGAVSYTHLTLPTKA